MPQRVPHRYWTVILGLVALAFAVVFGATVRFWLGPWHPVVALTVLGVAPMLFWGFVGAFVLDPTRTSDAIVGSKAPPLRERFQLTLLPIVFVGIPFLTAAATWNIPAVRVAVVGAAGGQGYVAGVAEALLDPDARVRLAACRSLAQGGAESASMQLAARLADPDEQVVDCALAALQPGSIDPVGVSLASSAWTHELVNRADIPAERACQLAGRVRSTERLGLEHAPLALFQCGLSAASPQGRECCAQAFRASLGSATPSMVLPQPATLVRTPLLGSVPALIELAFAEDDSAQRQRQQLRVDSPQEQAWSLAVGCEALSAGFIAREPVSAAMARAMSGEQCNVAPATERTIRIWTAACSTVFAKDSGAAHEHVPGALCEAVSGAIVADGLNEAQRRVTRAVREGEDPGQRNAMLELLLDYSAQQAASEPAPRKQIDAGGPLSFDSPGGHLVNFLIRASGQDEASGVDGEVNGDFLQLMSDAVNARSEPVTTPPTPPLLPR